jgi:Flp pilus assembly protein TadG
MIVSRTNKRRRGTILPLIVLNTVAMCGLVAMAVDLGLIALAKTQLQNAVDAGAVAGARSLDGTSTQNLGAISATTPNNTAMDTAYRTTLANQVLGATLNAGTVATGTPADSYSSTNLTIQFGAWHYSTTTQLFTPTFPPVAPDNYNLCQVSATYPLQTTFAPAFQAINPAFNSIFNVTAQCVAAHRPRDVCIILDYSGSMNNESDLWNNEAYLDNGLTNNTNGMTWPQPSNPNWTSNNVETVYPLFGHYAMEKNYNDYPHYANLLSPTADASSALSGSPLIGKSNVSISVLGVPAMVNDYYSNNRGAGVLYGFSSSPDNYAYGNTKTQGDNYLPKKGLTIVTGTNPTPPATFAQTVADVTGGTAVDANFETNGYKGYNGGDTFQGYTVGPRYWGKTFFVWPPDPTNDWRKKFFFESDGVTPCDDNTFLFSAASPGYNDPPGNYVINYKAILNWIVNTGANPFPTQMRSGNLIFYDAIPTDVPASAYDHTQLNSNITTSLTAASQNQRFWKEYIDYVLGVWRAPTGSIQHVQTPSCSIGPDYMFGTTQINSKPTDGHYMNYTDNPWRPRHRLWFGPMTMIQFLSDTGLLPGTAHDISMYPMKNGVGGALVDIQNNHPNDIVSMLLFSRPQFNNDNPGTGAFNTPQYNLTNDYASMINSLWLPPNTSSSDARMWDPNGLNTPRAHGDYNANTTSVYGFMMAYNQFCSSSAVQTAGVGGLGRKGATRLIIYETDGMANEDALPASGFNNIGAYNSYWNILPGQTINGGGYNQTNLLQAVEGICNKDDGTPFRALASGLPAPPSYPGFATINKPVIVHCIAFGAIFEVPSSIQTSSITLLQDISSIGGTTFPSSSTDPANGFKWCIGTIDQRRNRLKQAFLDILDSSVPVSLIQ